MGSLRTAMDAFFPDLDLSSPVNLEGTARAVPGAPPPSALARAPRAIRPQQLSFLRAALPLGIIPSLSPPVSPAPPQVGARNDAAGGLGHSLALQKLVPGPSGEQWWTGFVGQFRPGKLISNIRKQLKSSDDLELSIIKDITKGFLDRSIYALGVFSQFSFGPDTSVLVNREDHGGRKGRRKVSIFHKLPNHDITVEAVSPELFLDRKDNYWEVPSLFSLDISSVISPSGFRYRLGLHRIGGTAESINSSLTEVPESLMSGMYGTAAFSLERSKDFWREMEDTNVSNRGMRKGSTFPLSYDIRLGEPHSALSGIIGGSCSAFLGGENGQERTAESQSQRKYRFSADMFGSLCYTLQHGKFIKDYNDLTRVDARLDISSAVSFFKGASHLVSGIFGGHAEREVNPLAVPSLNVVFQQQVAGPIVFRADSCVSLRSPTGNLAPGIEDVVLGLSYSFRLLQSGKIIAWYSPRRKEAMIELRMFEF